MEIKGPERQAKNSVKRRKQPCFLTFSKGYHILSQGRFSCRDIFQTVFRPVAIESA